MLPEIFGTGFGGALLNLQKSLGQGLGGTFETLKSMLSEIFGTGFGGAPQNRPFWPLVRNRWIKDFLIGGNPQLFYNSHSTSKPGP